MDDPTNWKRNEVPKTFKNPLEKDFTVKYFNDKNETETYTIPPGESTYPTYLAKYFIKHLLDELINQKHGGYITPEVRAELQKEIEL